MGCGDGLPAHRKDRLGAIAVQIVWSTRRGTRQIEHLGSAHDEAELEAFECRCRAAAHRERKPRPTRGLPRPSATCSTPHADGWLLCFRFCRRLFELQRWVQAFRLLRFAQAANRRVPLPSPPVCGRAGLGPPDLLGITDQGANDARTGRYDHLLRSAGIPSDERWCTRLQSDVWLISWVVFSAQSRMTPLLRMRKSAR
jgi:hypothetical protein